MNLFSELGLSSELLRAIDKLGFEKPAPIQTRAIPLLMQGRDVVGQSQTGSGKTLAFAAPAIEKVDVNLREVQVLILCPTRELAVQVSEEVHKLAFFTSASFPAFAKALRSSSAPLAASWITCAAALCASTKPKWSSSTKPT